MSQFCAPSDIEWIGQNNLAAGTSPSPSATYMSMNGPGVGRRQHQFAARLPAITLTAEVERIDADVPVGLVLVHGDIAAKRAP